jgi:hypothetical protein
MASNGLIQRAKNGKCRICQRTRSTSKHVKAVGEVSHGFATGHVWECIDVEECNQVAQMRIKENHPTKEHIKNALLNGRFNEYTYLRR